QGEWQYCCHRDRGLDRIGDWVNALHHGGSRFVIEKTRGPDCLCQSYHIATVAEIPGWIDLRLHLIGLGVQPHQSLGTAVMVTGPHRPGTKRGPRDPGLVGDRGNHLMGLRIQPDQRVSREIRYPHGAWTGGGYTQRVISYPHWDRGNHLVGLRVNL